MVATRCLTAFRTFSKTRHLDLPHSLARDAEFLGKLSKRDWVFRQAPRFEDPTLANVEVR
jgi:hypothetical protein